MTLTLQRKITNLRFLMAILFLSNNMETIQQTQNLVYPVKVKKNETYYECMRML